MKNLNNKVYIGLGSNVGDRMNYIESAIRKINEDINCEVIEHSSIYESKPFGNIEQNNYLNAVVFLQTNYSPKELFTFFKKIELDIGRTKSERWGPREIDLDILFYNDLLLESDNLSIPHKGIIERDFVLVPLKEIAPDIIHPELNEKISDICERLKVKTITGKLSFVAAVK